MLFDKKMVARIVIAVLSFILAFLAGHASSVVLTGGVALLMVCLVTYEVMFCAEPQD